MKKSIRNWITIFFTLICLTSFQSTIFAQDQGQPVMKTISFFIIGGAAGGIGVGLAYFMLDPWGPNADFRGNVMTGLGIGALAGAIFSVVQLNKQVVVPYDESEFQDEFQGNFGRLEQNYFNTSNPSIDFASDSIDRTGMMPTPYIPIAAVQIRF